MIRGTTMIDRVSKAMTFGGGGLAVGSGYAQGGAVVPHYTITLADWGVIVGIIVGLIGGAVQIWSWWARWDSKKREESMARADQARADRLAEAELILTQARMRREQELHEAQLWAIGARRELLQ